ncbi:MAG: hypothetical protein ACFCGT_16660 [Sandaracinaceae bacterium]
MRRLPLLCLPLLLAAPLALTGCSNEVVEAPPGFILRLNFRDIEPAFVQQVRLTFTPSIGQGERWDDVESMSFEEGQITYDIESAGEALVVRVAGSYIEPRSVPNETGGFIFDFEFFTEDEFLRAMGPTVNVTVVSANESIGTGFTQLPSWPVPREGEVMSITAQVSCNTDPGRCRS